MPVHHSSIMARPEIIRLERRDFMSSIAPSIWKMLAATPQMCSRLCEWPHKSNFPTIQKRMAFRELRQAIEFMEWILTNQVGAFLGCAKSNRNWPRERRRLESYASGRRSGRDPVRLQTRKIVAGTAGWNTKCRAGCKRPAGGYAGLECLGPLLGNNKWCLLKARTKRLIRTGRSPSP